MLLAPALVDSAAVARVFAIANQKGGVAKTTTTQTVGLALADLGERVLLVDLDPQACLTFALGLEPEQCTPTLHDVFLQRVKAEDAIVDAGRVQLLPGQHRSRRLGAAPPDAHRPRARAARARSTPCATPTTPCSSTARRRSACSPSTVSPRPTKCSCRCSAKRSSHRGVAQLLETITDVREFTNPRLRVRGVIATMFDPRGRHAREVLDDVQTRFGLTVLDPPIPKTVRFAEAPGRGVSILEHAPSSAGAKAYRAIATAAARRSVGSGAPA